MRTGRFLEWKWSEGVEERRGWMFVECYAMLCMLCSNSKGRKEIEHYPSIHHSG